MKLNNIRYTDEDINNLDDYFSKEIEEYKKIEKSLTKEIDKQKEILNKIKEYINKHCVNDKISKEVGYKCFTMADTQELEHIWKLLEEME